jgi:hypothetical protein
VSSPPTLPCKACGEPVTCVGTERLHPYTGRAHECRKRALGRDVPTIGPMTERVYCTLYAMTGTWSPDFLHQVKVVYGGDEVPARFYARAAEIKKERACASTIENDAG